MGSVFNDFPNVLLVQIAVVGPTGPRTIDAFTRSDEPGENSEMALWNHKTTVMQSMAAKPDTGITGVVAKAKIAAKYWRQRGTFLSPQRLYLPATRTMGGACQPRRWSDKESLKKALCAYVNSSVGIGAMLSIRSNKAPTDPRFALNDLRGLRVPNFDVLDKSAEESLAGAYDELAEIVLLPLPLPEMEKCPVRQDLDMAVCDVLRLEIGRVAKIRHHLAAEPSVTGKRYAGWHLLSEAAA